MSAVWLGLVGAEFASRWVQFKSAMESLIILGQARHCEHILLMTIL